MYYITANRMISGEVLEVFEGRACCNLPEVGINRETVKSV